LVSVFAAGANRRGDDPGCLDRPGIATVPIHPVFPRLATQPTNGRQPVQVAGESHSPKANLSASAALGCRNRLAVQPLLDHQLHQSSDFKLALKMDCQELGAGDLRSHRGPWFPALRDGTCSSRLATEVTFTPSNTLLGHYPQSQPVDRTAPNHSNAGFLRPPWSVCSR